MNFIVIFFSVSCTHEGGITEVMPMGRTYRRTVRTDRNVGPDHITVVGRHGRTDGRLMGLLICPIASRQLGQGRLGIDVNNVPMQGPLTDVSGEHETLLAGLRLRKFYDSLLMLYE